MARHINSDDTARSEHETPAGARAVDEELGNWEAMLNSDVHQRRRERDRARWRADPENAPEGAAENLRRLDDIEDRYPDPNAAENAGVIRTVVGALDPRTFNRKSIWAGCVALILLAIIAPLAIGTSVALYVGLSMPWALIPGVALTVFYWAYF